MVTRGRFLERSLVAVGKIVDSSLKYVFPIRSGKMIGLISIARNERKGVECLQIFTNIRYKRSLKIFSNK